MKQKPHKTPFIETDFGKAVGLGVMFMLTYIGIACVIWASGGDK